MSVSTPYSAASLLPKLTGCLLLSLALTAQAQVASDPAAAPSAAPAPAAPASDKVVVLSPFVVNTARDQGFVATSSLAGGRLATDLKDTAAAYTVLTKEFVDAVGITSLADANKWTVNSSAADDDGGNMLIFRSVLANTRGVANNGNYRNFFPSTFYPDGFNIDRYDFARGPNAVLFGAGSIGGSPNVVTKQAVLGKGFTELRTVVGSWDNSRSTIDVNVPLGEKVAIRVNALYQNKGGWRQNDFDDKQALHLTSRIELTRNTQLNVEGEWGSFQRNTAFTTLNDRVSGWDGTTVFATGPASIPTALANSSSANRLGNPYILVSPTLTGGNQAFSFNNSTATRGGNESAAIAVGGVLVTSPLSAGIGTRGLLYALNEPDYTDRLKNILNSPLVPEVTKDFFRNLGPESTTSLDIPGNTYQYRTFSASLNHQIGEHWFFEGAANYLKELGKSELMDRGQMPVIRLDLVQNLPNGQPNPGFLQPYGEEPRTIGSNDDLTMNYRGAVAYVLKGTRFGDFMLNVLGGKQHRVDKQRRSIYTLTGLTADPRTWGQVSTINGVSVDPRIRYRYYWTINTPGNRGVPEQSDPLTVNINGTNYTGTPAWMVDTTTLSNTLDNTTDFSYLQSALNWKVWKGRLNFFAAVRHDSYASETLTPPPLGTDAAYGPGWDAQTIPFRPSAPSDYFTLTSAQQALYSTPKIDTGVTTKSFGGVFHVLPWLSVFADHATSFNLNGAGRTINGTLFAPQSSDGTDVGLRFSFFNDRLTGSVLRYTGTSANESISTGTAAGLLTDLPTAINNIINANPIGDGSPSNIRGLAAVPTGFLDRRARKAKGYELELTGNLTRHWRLLANLGVPDAVQTDAYADTRAYLAANDTLLRQILGDAGVTVGTGDVAAVNPVASNDAAAAATAWNNLQSFKQTVIAAPQKVTRLPKFTANLFTDYTLDHGVLKGLKFGAGINYRAHEVIGNKGADVIANPSAPAQSIDDPSVSPFDYVYSKDYYTGTALCGYNFRWQKKYAVSLDFRIDNLLDESDPVYYNTILRPPGGNLASSARVATPYQFYYITPRNYTLTVTLKF